MSEQVKRGDKQIKGIVAFAGIAIGKALVFKTSDVPINTTPITENEVSEQIARFDEAISKTKSQLEAIAQKAKEHMGEKEAEIFMAHISVAEDPMIAECVAEKIRDQKLNALAAVSATMEEIALIFSNIEDEYCRERRADIRDVGQRLLRNIAGGAAASLSELDKEVIIIAHDLTPSETASMNAQMVLGFVTEIGGRTSHTSIMARTLEIPAIVGAGGGLTQMVGDGDDIILDAIQGLAIIGPTNEQIEQYKLKQQQHLQDKKELEKVKSLPSVTLDGRQVRIFANIGMAKDVEGVVRNGAEGIGLFRTEFLYMDKPSLPSEDEQFAVYSKVAAAMQGKSVVIRTMDIGGDKKVSCIDIPPEANPFLGWRAIRICIDQPHIIRTQLRAILRASHYGKLEIMYPMIIAASEIRILNGLLKECKDQLRKEQLPFDEAIQVGIMVETPAAAMIADKLIHEVDFFSIGTNDLTQYTLAVDRGNEKIAALYKSTHPAVLRLIGRVIDASHKAGKWTGMCGEMAGEEKTAMLLLGMGLDEFSMGAAAVPAVRRLIRSLSYKEMQKVAIRALDMESAEEIDAYLDQIYREATAVAS